MAWKTDTQSGIAVRYHYDAVDRVARYTETGVGYSHSVSYTYNDVLNKPATMVETINGDSRATSYIYNDRNMISVCTVGDVKVTYGYDTLDRLTTKYTQGPNGAVIVEAYTYKVNADGKATNQIATYSVTANNQTTTYAYTYDDNGNIETITTGGKTTTYTYDRLNQLTREDNEASGYSYEWEYDEAGNIVACYKYNYTTGNLGSVQDFVDYYYEDYDWGDLLTYCYYGGAYGAVVSHDEIGNMLSDGERTYTWRYGRELTTLTKDGKTWNFTYDADGMRVRRVYGNTVYRYTYNGGLLTQMTVDIGVTTSVEYTLFFTYDAEGSPVSVTFNGTTYYYVTNLQGDVVGILDSTGATVVTYSYDAWGNILSVDSYIAIATLNPLRYRGYVYDTETGLYYVSSRYYNPEIGRWISADNRLSGAGGDLLGYNMFAYCMNNPVNMSDPTGNWPTWATKLVAAVAVVAVVAIVATVCVATCGAGSVVAGAAVGAAKGAAIGLATGAASGAAIGYATSGTLEGMLDGMADGALSGAISRVISGGISGGAKAMAQSSSRVLWSGGDAAKNAAASYAKSIGGATLEQTPKGKLLKGLAKIVGKERAKPLWEKASLEFASSAKGNVTAIVNRAGYNGAKSVLSRIEYPMVASRIIDGLVDSFNIILI